MADLRRRIAVVGGANVDIGGFPGAPLVQGDSNPGQVRITAGGVGRNIAENALRMGLQVELVSAIGGDANGRMLLEDCRTKGIGTRGCIVDEAANTSVYLFIADSKGDMHCAINDMEIQALLTPEVLAERLEMLNSMDAVVFDANLSEQSVAFLAENLRVPMFADAVSVAKAARLRPALGRLACLKPNRMEAELLTGVQIRDMMDAAEAARRLNVAGVKRVFLSMGEQGALCSEDGRSSFVPGVIRSMVSASGAGDAFTAALVWAHCEGYDLRSSCIAGMAAASIAVGSVAAVNPEMSRKNLLKRMADLEARL